MTTALIRFEAERARRADNRQHVGETGRCAECGEPTVNWSRCRPCRVKRYEDGARFNPPAGENWPTPPAAPLPDLIDGHDEPLISVAVPWE